MMKFFRRYTKQLLAVFMALLLFVWLAGDALTSLMRSEHDVGKQIQGTAYGETVRLHDMWPAFQETELLDEVGVRVWRAPWYTALNELKVQNAQQFGGEIRQDMLTKEEWYLLDAGARRANVHVPPEAVENFKTKIGLNSDILTALRQRTRKTVEEIDAALQSFLRVQEAAILAAQAVKVSEADINELVRQTGEKARITAVVVDPKKFVDDKYEPSPQEIQAQFEKYKNVASRPSEAGYEQPQAAQIEYIEVSADALAKVQKVTDDDAHAYWVEHSNEFKKPASQPTTVPATKPADEPKPYTSFSEARLKVIAKLQKDKAQSEAQRISREIIARLQGPWAKVTTTQPSDAKTAPDSEKVADLYSKLIDELNAKYGGALKYSRLQLLSQEDLQKQPAGSASAMQNSDQQMSVAEAAFAVPPLIAKAPATPREQKYYRGLFETAPEPFVSTDGSAYIVRTLAVRPRQPAAMDAVRTQIVQDIRNVRAREEAQKAARKLADEGAQKGLEAAFEADAGLKQRLGPEALKKPGPFAHKMMFAFYGGPQLYPGSIPGVGQNPELLDKLFGMASKATTQPNKVTMVDDTQQHRFLIAQLHEIIPIVRDDYTKQRAGSMQMLETQRRVQALSEWFDPQQIRNRVNWVDAPKAKPTEDTGNPES